MNPDRDLRELSELARSAERFARPLPPAQVRGLGARRRRRRAALVAAAAVIAVGGGLGLNQISSLQSEPIPAASPTASAAASTPGPAESTAPPDPATPTPTSTGSSSRVLTRAHLLKPSDIPWPGEFLLEVTTAVGVGHSAEQDSACFPVDGLAGLKADQVLSRRYVYSRTGAESKTPDPGGEPSIYSAALQFESTATAKDAYAQILDWRSDCESRLGNRGFQPVLAGPDDSATPVEAKGRQRGEFTRVVYRPVGGAEEAGIFESTGVTRVGDRLMVTVTSISGPDDNVTLDPKKASADQPLHPQFALIGAAAKRLE